MRKTQRQVAERQVSLIGSYHAAFSGPNGERVLMDLMQNHWVLRSSMGKDMDPIQLAFREGERNVILKIMHHLKIDPRQLLERIENHARDME